MPAEFKTMLFILMSNATAKIPCIVSQQLSCLSFLYSFAFQGGARLREGERGPGRNHVPVTSLGSSVPCFLPGNYIEHFKQGFLEAFP